MNSVKRHEKSLTGSKPPRVGRYARRVRGLPKSVNFSELLLTCSSYNIKKPYMKMFDSRDEIFEKHQNTR